MSKKQKRKLKKHIPNIYFNKSSIILSKDMEDLFNRGLNFSILPVKLDLTQVLCDFRYFERTMIWQEFWFGRDQDITIPPRIFKTKKTNLPKNYKTPSNLKTFLGAVKSEITDPQNRNIAKSNLPPSQAKALKELIQLQRDKQIVIKRCDKGAGVIILDYADYIKACNEHLDMKQTEENGEETPFYSKVGPEALDKSKEKIKLILEEAENNDIISKQEREAMDPTACNAGKFYLNFKVHKPHEKIPPGRPIVSQCGSVTSNIGKFIEYHINEAATQHPSYLQDTPDFIRMIERVNLDGELPINAMIATFDVHSLFTVIPHEEGVQATREALNERTSPQVPTEFIVRLLETLLSDTIFQFSDQHYKQNVGTTMGANPAPPFANIFMANIDKKILKLIEQMKSTETISVKCFHRFLDDLFKIFIGTTKQLHTLWRHMNQIHPSIKFTLQHTTPETELEEDHCDCKRENSVPFLDTSCSISNGKIILDLYRKPTDRNRYLLPDSCHPYSNIKNIPLSLAIRIVRICSEENSRELRFSELREMLLDRNYPIGIVNAAINKARAIPRAVAIRKVVRENTTVRRPVFVVSWDPRLPSLSAITQRHWRSMVSQDKLMEETFPEPPLIAYKRQKNIGDFLIRAKVTPQVIHEKRKIRGMKKCGKACHSCPYIKERKNVKSGKFTWNILDQVDCLSENVIYLIQCEKENCKVNKYIGETKNSLHERLSQHRGYVTRKTQDATGRHFNLPGHNLSHMKISVLEIVKSHDPMYRKERERYHIRKFNSYYQGMNGNPGLGSV